MEIKKSQNETFVAFTEYKVGRKIPLGVDWIGKWEEKEWRSKVIVTKEGERKVKYRI